jgi:uncharacterized protein YndB with AHSA1/START domain
MTDTTNRELKISRVFDAPRKMVFNAFTDPEHIALWWGPDGFTTTTTVSDIREGGVWEFVMHGPDGTDYPNKIFYDEIVFPERISYTHSALEGSEMSGFSTSFIFEEETPDATKVTIHSIFESQEELEKQKKFGAVEGGRQTLARLAEYLSGK